MPALVRYVPMMDYQQVAFDCHPPVYYILNILYILYILYLRIPVPTRDFA